ncbi:MAG: Sir2 family NAD-dependent protein deacetylase [Verrucomicrobiota bacterium]
MSAREKFVVISGAGLSAPSGLKTFRDSDGLWENHRVEDVASPAAWKRNPRLVLEFYNMRRAQAAKAQPNAGHVAIAALERKFDVVVITQNVDDLHERAGSSRVIHLHGELTSARSSMDSTLKRRIGAAPIAIGDLCELGGQLRPDIVWFGEPVPLMYEATLEVIKAKHVLVVGTSLAVYPAAGLLESAPEQAGKVYVDLRAETRPPGFRIVEGSADVVLPDLVDDWL